MLSPYEKKLNDLMHDVFKEHCAHQMVPTFLNGKLKNLETKEIGKETYPPKPKIRFGFSFFKIKIDLTKLYKIIKKDKIFLKKFLLVKVSTFKTCTLYFVLFFIKFLPLLSVTNKTSYPFSEK